MPVKELLVLVTAILAALPCIRSNAADAEPAATPTFTLTIIKAGTGDGSTTLPCGPAPGITHSISSGYPQHLTATPAPGSVFAGWSGDLPAGFSPREELLIAVMDRNRTVTATFMPAECTLTVKVAGTDNPVNVTPAPGARGCLSGQEVYLSALPADGSPAAFAGWSGDVTTDGFFVKVAMDGDKTVTATYTDVEGASRKLTVNPPQGTGGGTSFPLGPGTYRIVAGSTLKFGANPFPGSYFGGWMADYAGVNTPQEMNVVMDRDHTVGASFSNSGSTVTVILEGKGDILPRPRTYALAGGLQVPFTAQRIDRDWYFDRWIDSGGKVLSERLSFTFTVNGAAPETIKAVFTKDKKPSEVIARAPRAPFFLCAAPAFRTSP